MKTELEVAERLKLVKESIAFARILGVEIRTLTTFETVLAWVLKDKEK